MELIFSTLLLGYSLVPKCANVPQCDAEVLDWDRRGQREPVRGAVCQSFHFDHDAAQTGNTLISSSLW